MAPRQSGEPDDAIGQVATAYLDRGIDPAPLVALRPTTASIVGTLDPRDGHDP